MEQLISAANFSHVLSVDIYHRDWFELNWFKFYGAQLANYRWVKQDSNAGNSRVAISTAEISSLDARNVSMSWELTEPVAPPGGKGGSFPPMDGRPKIM